MGLTSGTRSQIVIEFLYTALDLITNPLPSLYAAKTWSTSVSFKLQVIEPQ